MLTVQPVRGAVGHAIHGDVGALQSQLRGYGAWGALVLVALILVHAVVLFPAEIANGTAGLVFGFWAALPIVLFAWTLSGLIAYALGAALGHPIAVKLAGARRVEAAERVIERGGVTALLLCRLVPFVPFSLVGYVAGALEIPLWRYTWTTFVGVLPITAAATYLGHALGNLSAADPLLWVAIAVLVILVVLTGVSARRLKA